jgi:predicted alpha/beta-hydrolase family hydrolase
MTIIYFPGYSTKNISEAENIVTQLNSSGYKTILNRWRHWEQYNGNILQEIDEDTDRIKSDLQNDEDIIIIGKSIGTYASIQLLKKVDLSRVNKVILLGIPFADLEPEEKVEYGNVLQNLSKPINILQNNLDDHGTPEQVKTMLMQVKYELKVIEADNHRYDYPEILLDIIKDAHI